MAQPFAIAGRDGTFAGLRVAFRALQGASRTLRPSLVAMEAAFAARDDPSSGAMDALVALPRLSPLLVVRDVARAIDFYAEAFDARVLARFVHAPTGALTHVDLALGGASFAVTMEARAWNADAPESLGGSPVVLQLRVADVDACFARACAAGASVVFPLVDFAGERMARVRDPFGHLWLLTQVLEELSPGEKQRRRDAFSERSNRDRT